MGRVKGEIALRAVKFVPSGQVKVSLRDDLKTSPAGTPKLFRRAFRNVQAGFSPSPAGNILNQRPLAAYLHSPQANFTAPQGQFHPSLPLRGNFTEKRRRPAMDASFFHAVISCSMSPIYPSTSPGSIDSARENSSQSTRCASRNARSSHWWSLRPAARSSFCCW